MCGIIGYVGAREASALLLDGLRRLEYRGYDSAGMAIVAAGGTRIVRCEGRIARLEERLDAEPLAGQCGIAHTRWATHGRPSETNAHPHRQGKVSLVHNGIIENHLELRSRLTASGRRFDSETDTEILAHLVDEALTTSPGGLREAVGRALASARGTWALCVVHDEQPGEIVVARQGSPLLLGLGGPNHGDPAASWENFVASDVAAILSHTRSVIDLEDGDTAILRCDGVEIFDAEDKRVDRTIRTVHWSPSVAEKAGFKHFMLKEIHEQPQAITDTLLGRISLESADVDFGEARIADAALRKVTLLGCGTSWHAALAGKYLIEGLARIPVEVDLASEFRYRNPLVGPQDYVVAISQSGETADTLAGLKEAARLGAETLAICNVNGSSIARAAQATIYTHAGPEISVASTKAFTTQLCVLTLLAIHLGRRNGKLSRERALQLLHGLRAIPEAVEQVLGQRATIRILARRYIHARDVLYLGRGLGYPVALEGALKLKEISYLHAEGYASGEMKHGPIALVDETVPVVMVALKGSGYEKVLSNLSEIRARGGRVIALATVGDAHIGDLADEIIMVPDVATELQPILASVPLQLFAYDIADIKGTDVDQPRNLAKSVTVE